MLHKILPVFLLVCLCEITFGQQDSSSIANLIAARINTTFGLKAGYTTNWLKGDDIHFLSPAGKTVPLQGFFASIAIYTRLTEHFGLSSEISIAQSGAVLRIKDSLSGKQFDSKFKSLYLTVQPLSPTLYYKKLRIHAGLFASALIRSSIERMGPNGDIYVDKSIFGNAVSPGGYRQKYDAGFVAGVEYECKNGITIGTFFKRGFVPVMEDTRLQQQWKIYNQSLIFHVGFHFR
ncbi:MAG: outer membrane beta-barrel protein [Chitinophagaceae bacterium]|nr:outer membrane beta-barrel protein [Chitinophagaceae bacterium]